MAALTGPTTLDQTLCCIGYDIADWIVHEARGLEPTSSDLPFFAFSPPNPSEKQPVDHLVLEFSKTFDAPKRVHTPLGSIQILTDTHTSSVDFRILFERLRSVLQLKTDPALSEHCYLICAFGVANLDVTPFSYRDPPFSQEVVMRLWDQKLLGCRKLPELDLKPKRCS